jgi:hypothetical protein
MESNHVDVLELAGKNSFTKTIVIYWPTTFTNHNIRVPLLVLKLFSASTEK